MLLKLSEYLLPQGVGDLRVHTGVPNILLPQVICNILNPSPSFEKMYGTGMSESMHGAAGDTGCLCVGVKEVLYLAFLHCALPSCKEVGRHTPSDSQVRTQAFCRVSPQRFLSPQAVLETAYPHTMIF